MVLTSGSTVQSCASDFGVRYSYAAWISGAPNSVNSTYKFDHLASVSPSEMTLKLTYVGGIVNGRPATRCHVIDNEVGDASLGYGAINVHSSNLVWEDALDGVPYPANYLNFINQVLSTYGLATSIQANTGGWAQTYRAAVSMGDQFAFVFQEQVLGSGNAIQLAPLMSWGIRSEYGLMKDLIGLPVVSASDLANNTPNVSELILQARYQSESNGYAGLVPWS